MFDFRKTRNRKRLTQKIEKKRFRIKNELQITRDSVARMSALLIKNLAKINHLEKQQAFLRKREDKIIRRDIENIKALEKLKEENHLLKKKADANTVAISEPTGANFFSASDE